MVDKKCVLLKKTFKLKGFVFQIDLFLNDFIPKLQKRIDFYWGKRGYRKNDICIKTCCVLYFFLFIFMFENIFSSFFNIEPLDAALL